MTSFRYRAARDDGGMLAGLLEAPSAGAALETLETRGLFPVSVEQQAATAATPPAGSLEIASALAGLAALLETGMPVDRALAAAEETVPALLAAALAAAREQVRQGAPLSTALASANAVPAVVIAYLKAGERTGDLAASLARAASELEQAAELRSRIRATMTYPLFLGVTGLVSVAAIVGFVVPRFVQLIDAGGRTLPASTRLLVGLSNLGERYGLAIVVVLLAAIAVAARALQSAGARAVLHQSLLQLPLIGALRLRLASARACGALASLLEAGVPILAALAHAQGSAADAAVERRIAAASLEVERGEKLSAALRRNGALSPVALRLAAFGEGSGRLAPFLAHAARLDSAHAQRTIQRLVTLLEPVLILGFGAVVAFVALAVFQAIYTVRPGA